jgi:hypothetical protein
VNAPNIGTCRIICEYPLFLRGACLSNSWADTGPSNLDHKLAASFEYGEVLAGVYGMCAMVGWYSYSLGNLTDCVFVVRYSFAALDALRDALRPDPILAAES